MSAASQRYFFCHLQKTAGTALWRRLHHAFDDAEIYPGPGDGQPPESTLVVEQMVERFRARSDEIRIITGHFPLCCTQILGVPMRTFTTLRDPVERILSSLRKQRQTVPALADAPLEQIYEDPIRYEMLHNHMVKMFSLTPDEMTDGALTSVRFTADRLERAKEQLRTVDVIGLQEDFEAFCDELSDRFGWDLGPPVFMNRTKPMDVPESLRRRLAEDNADDYELYEFARQLVAERAATTA